DYDFTAHQVNDVIGLLDSDSGKYINSSTHRIFKNRNWLIINLLNNSVAKNILIENEVHETSFEEGKLIISSYELNNINESVSMAQLDFAKIKFPLVLRKWKQGDYFYPLGMQKQKKISRFLIDQKLSLTQKEKIWVLEMDKKIVWVVGMRIDDRFKITPQTKNILEFNLIPAE
ncbi:MAG: tRNA lysidine(34) synthetase TilS, partial [Ferruginibacter sp.]